MIRIRNTLARSGAVAAVAVWWYGGGRSLPHVAPTRQHQQANSPTHLETRYLKQIILQCL
jgi:hypothetical protein